MPCSFMCMDGALPFESGLIMVGIFPHDLPSSLLTYTWIGAGGWRSSTNAMMSPLASFTVTPPGWKPGLAMTISGPQVLPPSSLRLARTWLLPQVAMTVPFMETTMLPNRSPLKTCCRSMCGFSKCGFNGPSTSAAVAMLWLHTITAVINMRNFFCIRPKSAITAFVVNGFDQSYSLVKARTVF